MYSNFTCGPSARFGDLSQTHVLGQKCSTLTYRTCVTCLEFHLHTLRHRLVDAHDRNCISACGLPAKVEGCDVDAGIPEYRAKRADERKRPVMAA